MRRWRRSDAIWQLLLLIGSAILIWLLAASLLTVAFSNVSDWIEPIDQWYVYVTVWRVELQNDTPDTITRLFLLATGGIPLLLGMLAVWGYFQLRRSWWRWRRVRPIGYDALPPTIERANTDNLGHSRLMDHKTARALFPGRTGKVIGMLSDGLLFDECFNTSGISLEFVGTRMGKTSRAITTISFWDNCHVIFDPANEIAPMMWRLLTARGRRVFIMTPVAKPLDAKGQPELWAPFVAHTNVLSWIDINDPLAEVHVSALARLFLEEEDVRSTDSGAFFSGNAETLLTALIAHVLWDTGYENEAGKRIIMPKDLISVYAYISSSGDKLREYLKGITEVSPSLLARQLAAPLADAHPETFSDIHNTLTVRTKWLAIGALADMVCGDDFRVTDICKDPWMSLFIQIPMNVCDTYPIVPRVVFGALMNAKIQTPGTTFPLVLTDESWMLKVNAIRQIVLNGGKYRIALHMLWQSMADMNRVWGADTRKSFFDGASWIALGPLGSVEAARDVSEACGSYGALAYSKGDNTSSQLGSGFWSRWSIGSNVNRHPVRRPVFFAHEIMQDLHRGVRLILRLKQPLIVGAAPFWEIPELNGRIDHSPYARFRRPENPWYRIALKRRKAMEETTL